MNGTQQTPQTLRIRLGALALAAAGLLFLLYPGLRPFSDETSLQGAAAFGSSAWLLSHILAIAAFVLAALGLLGLHLSLQNTAAERLAFWGLALAWLGAGLTLPFYGAEVFALNVIGREAQRLQDPALLELANQIRFGPGFAMIVIGLLTLAAGTTLAAGAIWKSGRLAKWSGIPIALGFWLYLPQYLGSQPIRVAHGLLITFGCLWVAAGMWRAERRS